MFQPYEGVKKKITKRLNGCDYINIVGSYINYASSESLKDQYKCNERNISRILDLCNVERRTRGFHTSSVQETKVCKDCNLELNKKDNFNKYSNSNCYRARCIKCDSEHKYQRWLKDKERLTSQRKERQLSDVAGFRASRRAYSRKYKNDGRYYKKYTPNPELQSASQKKYRAKESSKAKRRKYMADAYKKMTPAQRLCNNVKKVVHKQLKFKDDKTFTLCGYHKDELISHIESLFTNGMDWSNYGKHGWHLDHIRPLASFDLDNKEEFKKAWALDNLQPLWANDNCSKSSVYNGVKYFYNR